VDISETEAEALVKAEIREAANHSLRRREAGVARSRFSIYVVAPASGFIVTRDALRRCLDFSLEKTLWR
jgi:hypothetical protein